MGQLDDNQMSMGDSGNSLIRVQHALGTTPVQWTDSHTPYFFKEEK